MYVSPGYQFQHSEYFERDLLRVTIMHGKLSDRDIYPEMVAKVGLVPCVFEDAERNFLMRHLCGMTPFRNKWRIVSRTICFIGNQRDNINGYSKSLVLRETNVALGLQEPSGERPELGEDKNAVGVSVIFIENESEEVTTNGKKISISEKSQISVQNIPREFQDNLQETNYETELRDIKARMSSKSMESKFGKNTNSSAQIANKTGFQATFKIHQHNVGNVNNPGSSLVSAGLEDMRNRKKRSLNPKFNYRPHQLCENPHLNSRQTETTELGEFVKNAVETSTPGVNRKLPVQEMEKDNVAIPTANRPKRWRLSGLRRTGISPKK
ncbi:hypothetical protein GQX74_011177 [Glossina fuscipes]|nr:hypothetical protein GQX74_011177 [Glossina fuscipes]